MSLTRLSGAIARRARRLSRPAWFGTLRRLTPLSDCSGYDRGLPIDRHYVEAFLRTRAETVRGVVLEVRDDRYAASLGRGVTRVEVVDIDATNPRATLHADLCAMPHVPTGRFDCAIVTQTLQYVEDVASALRELRRVLAPGGVLLATVPAAAPLDTRAAVPDRWRFTATQLEDLLHASFGGGDVVTYGNPLALTGAIMGVASDELSPSELAHTDPRYPVIFGLTARAY